MIGCLEHDEFSSLATHDYRAGEVPLIDCDSRQEGALSFSE